MQTRSCDLNSGIARVLKENPEFTKENPEFTCSYGETGAERVHQMGRVAHPTTLWLHRVSRPDLRNPFLVRLSRFRLGGGGRGSTIVQAASQLCG